MCRSSVLLLGCLAVSLMAQAPPPDQKLIEYNRAHYTKYEYRIPMRDGKRLFTSVYVPKDTAQKYPILFDRTPYSVAPYGVDNYRDHLGPSDLYSKAGYIFVYQDVRGAWMSEGEYVNMRPHKPVKSGPQDFDESTDTYDTIDWLVKHLPNNNGRVGMWGISYPGFYTSAGMIDAHPALKAASPQAPISDWYIGDDFHHNGTLYLPHAFRFLAGFGKARPEPRTPSPAGAVPFDFGTVDGYQFYLQMGPLANANERYFKNTIAFWNDLMKHGSYDEFWQARNLRPHLKNIKPAVLTVGGWYDAEDLFGALETYKWTEKMSPGASNRIVMGPWYHGGWARSDGDLLGNARFDSKTSAYYREKVELPFFEFYLKDKGEMKLPEAVMFETGTNQWREFDAWPPKGVKSKTLYFRTDGKLSFDPPASGENAFDEYVSDPSKPVPYVGGVAINMTREHMTEDQRFASTRPDVLVYQTEPLQEDVTLAGPLTPSLQVSTTGTDSDWVVKLIDVFPNDAPDFTPNPAGFRVAGYQQLVRGEAVRGKFRNSFEKPEPFTPGKVTKVEYVMPDVLHTFRRGHRIMVQVQSTWFPLVDRNPQQFLDIYNAKSTDFVKATQRVYHSGASASALKVGILE